MRELLRAWRCPQGSSNARERLRFWYRTVVGEALAAKERELLDNTLETLFGYHLLQLGEPTEHKLCGGSRIPNTVVLEGDFALRGAGECCSDLAALPIATDSVDVVVLPHTLEYEPQPHQLLAEVERVLIPEGHLVLLGFNPLSLWGLIRLLWGWRGRLPWCGHFYSSARIRDWLALLQFEVVRAESYFCRPPLQQQAMLQRLLFLERFAGGRWPFCGAGYILVARKRTITFTPIRPRWRTRRILGAGLSGSGANRESGQSHHYE